MKAQDLKNSILQLAVQGKLVEQREEEGTAKELLEQIQAEKERLIKEKKIKKEKPLPEITEEEKPFEIPESWEWVRLVDIVYLNSGNQYEELNDGLPYIKVADMNLSENQHEIVTSTRFVSPNNVGVIPINSIIFPKRGGAIATNKKRVVKNMPIYIDSNTMGMTAYLNVYFDYLKVWFESIDLVKIQSGTAVPQINNKDIYPLVFSLPPLAEQKRIVAKIEEILPYIEQYDKAYTKLETFNKKFPSDMKKSILQLAMQGKLVEQREEEGTAEELYQQIVAEKARLIKVGKIKKEKPLAEITDDEKLFEIPESWKWVRLNDLVSKTIKRGKSPTYVNISSVQVFAQKCNVKTGGIDMSLAKYLDENKLSKYPEDEFLLDKDIVINSTGTGTMGRIGIFSDKDRIDGMRIVPDSHVTSVRLFDSIEPYYIFYLLRNFQRYLESMGEGSTNQKELKPLTIMNLVLPLPPLAEQKRIVAKIEQILPYCDQLMK